MRVTRCVPLNWPWPAALRVRVARAEVVALAALVLLAGCAAWWLPGCRLAQPARAVPKRWAERRAEAQRIRYATRAGMAGHRGPNTIFIFAARHTRQIRGSSLRGGTPPRCAPLCDARPAGAGQGVMEMSGLFMGKSHLIRVRFRRTHRCASPRV